MVQTEMLLYERVAYVAEDYFGPAAPRYIERLISSHLNKQAADLEPNDLPELIEWVRVTVAMLTEHEDVIESLTTRLSSLYEKPKGAYN